nr:putative ribonuclease H-like domain-containing protein [Tanacetum cinerariifolium]
DTNGVEADLSNMENNISASPTPTFRIHKDHPTSQIIGLVDTLVQTRNKSKEMKEQSFIASIHHMTNPDLLQFYLFSCFLSQEEPKKISDALKDPSWPTGFQDPEFPARVYKVGKAMYELHQAHRAWYGTKEAASQDVSSLRYIALPNLFHKAYLESSTSNAQDDCKADAPESMETPIPTVSSPVPTACLDDSPQLSSDTNGVEADLSNMENNISASPTPTFRIHKDHPTSQIIGLVDTLVQTRNKSKEMKEQSFIASIHHMTNPDLLQFYLFSCFLSQEEPKKISDALKDPRVRPIGTKWVLKNKKDERGIVIRNKARLVAQGHTQEEGIDYEDMDVKSAFLYGTINEEVYVMQPPGFQDPKFPARVYKVEKEIEFEALMHEKFQISAMGELNFFLGLQVLQKKDGIFLSHDKYVGDILKKFGYLDVKSANTPMDKKNPWGKDGTDAANQEVKKDVSSLRYILLPNWAHDTLLQSSSSKPHDESSTKVPEGSGKPNPTDSSSNPPADQIETLTVESPIPTVLKNKKDKRGIVVRNKARLVAQGHTQKEGIDYGEVFAPVARIEAIRLFLAYASFMGFTVYQMDLKSAFLYGTIDEEVYVMQPPGFQDPAFPAKVYKAEKAMGTIDQTLFIRRQKEDFILVQVYVDDIIFGSSNPQLCREFEALTYEKFQMSAMGELNFFLGLQVLQKEDGIFLSQDKYIGDILKKFGYSDVRSSNTPMDKYNPWGKDGTGKDVDLHLYRSMIGSLMYLTASRPDIMFAVSYSDSDYGGASQDRKSTTEGSQFLLEGRFQYLVVSIGMMNP